MTTNNYLMAKLSPVAQQIIRLFIKQSKHGNAMDPELSLEQVREGTEMSDDNIFDAVDELKRYDLIHVDKSLENGLFDFHTITPKARLFSMFDQIVMLWNPNDDARHIASDLVRGDVDGVVPNIANAYDWLPRRMNPAINYLVERRLVDFGNESGTYPWSHHWVSANLATRHFVRDRS